MMPTNLTKAHFIIIIKTKKELGLGGYALKIAQKRPVYDVLILPYRTGDALKILERLF